MSAPPPPPPRSARGRRGRADDEEGRAVKKVLVLRRLLSLLRPYRVRFAVATVALVIGSSLSLLYPQAARFAVDAGLREGAMERLNLVGAGLVAAFFASALLTWLRHYLMSWLGERVVADVRKLAFDRLLSLPPSWFHEHRSGELTGRLAADVATIQSIVGSELSMALRELITLIGGLSLLFYENWHLTLIMLGIIPPIIFFVFVFGRQIRQWSERVQDRFAETSAQVQETIGAIQTVQSFGREPLESSTYGKRIEEYFGDIVVLSSRRGLFIACMSFAGWSGIATIVWFGGRAVIAGTLTAGDLAAFLLYTSMVAVAIAALASLWGSLNAAAGATKRLFEIIDTEPAIKDPASPVPLPPGHGAIEFDDVTFAYSSRAADPVIRGIHLSVKAGEMVALVGRSGAGKSTITALVQRFYDATGGRVLVEGQDVRTLRLADLRREIAIVAQEPVLFSGSVRDNIAYGREGASTDDVVAAAEQAHAHAFIETLPEQYDTRVGERGVKLSGGQRQRIAIARAILRDPRILILDEATSNLDSESEALVQEALQHLMRGRTTLVVAHRLSTVRDADRIVVVDRGRIIETGTHDELMSARGLYRTLVEHQLIFAEAESAPAAP